MMELKTAVERYLAVVKEFGQPMPLAEFGVPRKELEAMLETWEEDYQLHRHLELLPATRASQRGGERAEYAVHGIPYASVVFHQTILDMLPP